MVFIERFIALTLRSYRTKTINGKKFKLPLLDKASLYYPNESWMSSLIYDYFINGTTFIDVGVNVGNTMLTFKSLFPDDNYLGFEPNPKCVAYSENLISLNNIENAVIIPAALSDSDGITKLYFTDLGSHDSTASIVNGFRKNIVRSAYVPCISKPPDIDGKVGLIKIDVEGSEGRVVKSLIDVIIKDRPVIIIEILPVYNQENTDRLNRQLELEKIIKEINYCIRKVSTRESIESIGIHSNLRDCDYLLCPL